MKRRVFIAVSGFSSLALLWSAHASAEPKYQQVNTIDLVGGHIPDDTWIETTGRVWPTPHGVFFGIGMPSAMAPIKLDTSSVPPQQVDVLTSKCKADNTFTEGCQATIRGKTGRIDARRAVFATSVALQ